MRRNVQILAIANLLALPGCRLAETLDYFWPAIDAVNTTAYELSTTEEEKRRDEDRARLEAGRSP